MSTYPQIVRKVTAEKAVEVLTRNGITLDVRQAQRVLDFLYFLVQLEMRENKKN